MARILHTNGTGSTQTVSQSETYKLPIYSSEQDVVDDLANLEVGDLVATNDPSESETIAILVSKIQELEEKVTATDGEIIWENPNPTQSYPGTYNVPLLTGKKFSDYRRISIECADSNIEYFDINMFINSGQTGVTQGLNNSGFQSGPSAIFNRCFKYESDTTFDIGSCFVGGNIYDNALIPLRIKGYK